MNLDRAITIAVTEFSGITDKAGSPYILHLLRVMLAVESEGESAMIVAVLHDLLEDRPAWNALALRAEGFGPVEIDAIVCLTRRQNETYAEYIKRIGSPENRIARIVKIADLRHNMSRSSNLSKEVQTSMRTRYVKALSYLQSVNRALVEAEDRERRLSEIK